MRYDRDHHSRDVDDRRGQASIRGPDANLVFLLLRLGARFGWPGIVVAVLAVVGITAVQTFSSGGGGGTVEGDPAFASFVFDDVQTTFAAVAPGYGRSRMVLYRGGTATGCGYGDAATGPFYCPADQQVYLDLSFFEELGTRFGAPGDFAAAYVIAHEVGHHLQHLAGVDRRVRDRTGADSDGVRLELQADCLAGVWAASAARRGLLEPGDLDEGLRAAAAVGDDALQRASRGRVVPDSFTHGTSAQRARAFRDGLEGGAPASCGL